jgi:hypothetical protein
MIRKLMVLFFVYLIVEGALRKWLFPEASAELYVLKDGILLVAFIAFVSTNVHVSLSYLRRDELALWMLWLIFLLGFFLLRNPSLARVAGLRYYLAPLPLLLLVPYAIGGLPNLQRVAVAVMVMTIPLGILGFVQYLSPLDSEINRYAWATGQDAIASFGVGEDQGLRLDIDRPRVTSTFSYISTYAAYLVFAVLVVWAGVAGAAGFRTWLLGSSTLLLIFANLAMTGSRGPMAIGLALSVPFVYILLKRVSRSRSPVAATLAILAPVCGALMFVVVDAFEALAVRFEQAGDTENRLLGVALFPITTLLNIDPFGQGIGATFAGMEELGASGTGTEGFHEVIEDRVGVELGYVGYVLVLYLKLHYLFQSWALYRRCARVPDLQVWALAALAIQLSSIWQIPFHNAIAASAYFASLGLFLWVRKEHWQRMRQAPEVYRARAQHRLLPARTARTNR